MTDKYSAKFPRTNPIDARTGFWTREWEYFFRTLLNRTGGEGEGGGNIPENLDDLSLSINYDANDRIAALELSKNDQPTNFDALSQISALENEISAIKASGLPPVNLDFILDELIAIRMQIAIIANSNDFNSRLQAIESMPVINQTLQDMGYDQNKAVTTDGTQTLSNKTLDNSNVITVKDASLTIQDDADTTKQAKFQTSGIATATTRTFTLPDANATLAYVGAPNLLSGTYTPTLFNTTNIDASTAYVAHYMRLGNNVIVSGWLNVDATSTATLTKLGIELPIATTFSSIVQCTGTAASEEVQSLSAGVRGDTTNNRAVMTYISSSTANVTMTYIFMYEVL